MWHGREKVAFGVVAEIVVVSLFAFLPRWNVYRQELGGKTTLRETEYTRQIAVLDAQAEVERARGVAEANRITGDSLKDNEGYLRYL